MDLEDVLARIESRLAALGLSAHGASLAAHKPDAIRNLKRAVKSGDRRGITTETLSALAPVLQTTAAWLLGGVGEADPNTHVRVVGRIGAGAEIYRRSSKFRRKASLKSRSPSPSQRAP